MRLKTWTTIVLIAMVYSIKGFAYEVWLGTAKIPHSAATNTANWSRTASKVEGLNINRAANLTDPATKADWIKIIGRFTNAQNKIVECPRSGPSRNLALKDELLFPSLTNWVNDAFALASTYQYTFGNIMFYDNAIDTNNYSWTTIEVQMLRNILDGRGNTNVGLIYDARSIAKSNKDWCANPLVDHALIEGSANDIFVNANGKRDLAAWLYTNPVTANKKIIFQLPRSENTLLQYQATRQAVQRLGSLPPPLGMGFLRDSRVVFLPCNYNLGDPPQFDLAPETMPGNGALYTNSLSGLCLSLIEQRDFFEGRLANLPTLTDADSYVRNSPPDISGIPDQELNLGESTGALPFIVDDEQQTPAGSLVVTWASSNTNLVPTANVVLGGSGSNRTVTVTPAAGQTGSTTILLSVSDGLYSTTNMFSVTVIPSLSGTLVGNTNDISIKEDLTFDGVESLTSSLGSRGSDPYTERCVVYVFQLPDWGTVANPFLSSSFAFNFVSKNSNIRNYDLYGLGRRASATVLAEDFYAMTSTPDPTDATRLEANILGNLTATGLVASSSGGSSNLLTYLNAQYASGAGAGQYVFLRLNSTSAKTGISYATVSMADATATNLPRIDFTAIPPNTAPQLTLVSNRTLMAGQILTITNVATDADIPAQALTFSLVSAPAGAAIEPQSGVLTWQPAIAQSPSTNFVRVRVTDNAPASLSATNSFTVTVLRPVVPVLSKPVWSEEGFAFTVSGDYGPDYTIFGSTNLIDWLPVGADDGAPPPFLFTDTDTNTFKQRFYRVLLGP